jgi:VWFA-related protein
MLRITAALFIAVTAAPQLQEKITVERVIVDARVTRPSGDPITGLTPKDFAVRIDGKPARVESVEWISEVSPETVPAIATDSTGSTPSVPRRGRLLIFFFQTDFSRSLWRVYGHMKLLQTAEYLDMIQPGDRVAVLSYDSRLKFRLDFTEDKRKVKAAMDDSIFIDNPPRPPAVPEPSIGTYLDDATMKHKTDTIGEGIHALAEALRKIPGPKSLIFFSWGLGEFTPQGVFMDRNYGKLAYVLDAARVTVYSIDFTQADWHSLQAGQMVIAEDTGGFYANTYRAPKYTAARLNKTMSGHYELEVRRPEPATSDNAHAIKVTTTHPDAVVMSRSYFLDSRD